MFGKIDFLIVNTVIIILFYLLIFDFLKFIAFKPLLFIGKISYSLYLIHQLIGYIIIMELKKNEVFNQFILLLIPFVFSILLSSFVHFKIEPAVKKYLNLLNTKSEHTS